MRHVWRNNNKIAGFHLDPLAPIERAHDLGDSAEQHRRIYLAIRARDPERARAAMADHLRSAQAAQAAEEAEPATGAGEAPHERKRRAGATKQRRKEGREEA